MVNDDRQDGPTEDDPAPKGFSMADRLENLFARQRLTPTHRAIAQCLVAHADQAAFLSAGELAELADVSQSSVSRFAMALGYSGYPDLRKAVRSAVDQPPSGRSTPRLNRMQQAVDAEVKNLQLLRDSLADPSVLAEAGAALAKSRPLAVLGLRNCMPLAVHFRYLAARVHPDVRLIGAGDSSAVDQLEQATSAGATWLLCFALPRHSRDLFGVLELARDMGLRIVSIVDSTFSPVAELSDLTLSAPLGTQLIFDVVSAPLTMMMLLLQAMCDAMPGDWQQRLERFEELSATRRVFTENGKA